MPRIGPRPVVATRALLCAAALVLLVVPSASAAGGEWWPKSQVKRLHFESAPYTVKPGQNGIDNLIVPPSAKPSVDGWIVRAKPDLVLADGSVPPVDFIHLHHGVWLNLSKSSPGSPFPGTEPIFFGGEEKTVFRIPKGYGYRYKRSDTWLLNQMIHNNTAREVKGVRLVWDIDFIPSSSKQGKKVKEVTPVWMDIRAGWAYPVFDVFKGSGGDGKFTFPDEAPGNPYANGPVQNELKLPFDGTIVAGVGHLHPGGLYDDVDLIRPGAKAAGTKGSRENSARILRTDAKYYDHGGPISWDLSIRASRPDWRVQVKQGDTVRISSTYETEQASWYESMGIVLLYVAKGEKGGVDPFAKKVDWRGVLTHRHLTENDNHGGEAGDLTDPRKVGSGSATTQVRIKGFQYLPGDLSELGGPNLVPVVPKGQNLLFVNEDDPEVAFHTITSCREPCNRLTGISYPLADALSWFDSGELGYGPAGLSPAANRLTWQASTSKLDTGTYTYFCRIHPFMRGAFRVQ
jgi:plastocyanin